MKRSPLKQCPDCQAAGFPECSRRCAYCVARANGKMNTLEDRINHPKLIPDFTVHRDPNTLENRIIDPTARHA